MVEGRAAAEEARAGHMPRVPPVEPMSSSSHRFDSLAVAAVSASAGIIAIGRKPLWLDEAVDVQWTHLGWHDYLSLTFRSEMGQTLWLLLLKPWLSIAGHGEVAARAPSVLFAAAACALLVPVGRTLLGGRLAGAAAGLLMACSAFVVAVGAASSHLHSGALRVGGCHVPVSARSPLERLEVVAAVCAGRSGRRLHAFLRWTGAGRARSRRVDVQAAAGATRGICRIHRRAAGTAGSGVRDHTSAVQGFIPPLTRRRLHSHASLAGRRTVGDRSGCRRRSRARRRKSGSLESRAAHRLARGAARDSRSAVDRPPLLHRPLPDRRGAGREPLRRLPADARSTVVGCRSSRGGVRVGAGARRRLVPVAPLGGLACRSRLRRHESCRRRPPSRHD